MTHTHARTHTRTHISFAYLEHAFSFARLPPPRQLIFWLCTSPASHNWINARENALTYRTLGKTRGDCTGWFKRRDQKLRIFLRNIDRGRFSKISDLFFFFLIQFLNSGLFYYFFFLFVSKRFCFRSIFNKWY